MAKFSTDASGATWTWRSQEPQKNRESDEENMEKKWERSGEPQKNRESDEENMEEEWERTGDKLRRPRRWTT